MLMKRSKVKVSYRVVADALHERGLWFRSLRAKPILTPQDVKDRYAFAGQPGGTGGPGGRLGEGRVDGRLDG